MSAKLSQNFQKWENFNLENKDPGLYELGMNTNLQDKQGLLCLVLYSHAMVST